MATKTVAPIIRINRFITESETSEHKGFANLLKASAPGYSWPAP